MWVLKTALWFVQIALKTAGISSFIYLFFVYLFVFVNACIPKSPYEKWKDYFEIEDGELAKNFKTLENASINKWVYNWSILQLMGGSKQTGK